MEASTVDYTRQLRRLRFRKRVAWAFCLTIVLMGRHERGAWKIELEGPIGIAFTGLFLFCGLSAMFARCPQCHKLFHMKWLNSVLGYGNFFSRKCLNCGLSYKGT